jgi:hypothetical protein
VRASLFCAIALVVASGASADPDARPTLVAPHAGIELGGGDLATIEWRGDVDPCDEEWEAFLSIDGGAWYAARITPHLDLAMRRFVFRVPNVATRNARILIRTGDERDETAFELPEVFSIRATPVVVAMDEAIAANREESEGAREGERPAAEWVGGDRQGRNLSYNMLPDRDDLRRAATPSHPREGEALVTRQWSAEPLQTSEGCFSRLSGRSPAHRASIVPGPSIERLCRMNI